METYRLVSTREKLALLGVLLRAPSDGVRVRESAALAGVSPGFVSRYLRLLEKEGVAEGGGISFSNARVRALKAFLNIGKVFSAGIWETVKREVPGVRGAGVYGSWLSGTNREDSDLDVWVRVKGRPAASAVARAARLCREALGGGVDVELKVVSDAELAEMRARTDPFYFSLYNSFALGGEGVD